MEHELSNWTRIVLDEAARGDLAALQLSLGKIAIARDVFALDLPPGWGDALDLAEDGLSTLRQWHPGDALEFRYVVIGYQGGNPDPILQRADALDRVGLGPAAEVIRAWCKLAQDTPAALFEPDEDSVLPDCPAHVSAQLSGLKARWDRATGSVTAAQYCDLVARLVPIAFEPAADFHRFWLDRITASNHYGALPDETLWSRHALPWRPQAETLGALEARGIHPSFQLWTETRPGQVDICIYVASNVGVLRVEGTTGHPDARLYGWPDGELILQTDPPRKNPVKGAMDIPTRLEFNTLSNKLAVERDAIRRGPLFEARLAYRNLRDVIRYQYLRGMLGVGDTDLLLPMANILGLAGVLVFGLLGLRQKPRVDDLLTGQMTFGQSALAVLVAMAALWLVVELIWRLPSFLAVLHGTITRGRGRCPVHSSFGGAEFNRRNLVLRLMRFQDREQGIS